jgi:hypothetical protein
MGMDGQCTVVDIAGVCTQSEVLIAFVRTAEIHCSG